MIYRTVLRAFIVLLVSCCLRITYTQAQSIQPQVIAAGGKHFAGSNAQLSLTLGEAIITTSTGNSAIITQGFQQPNDSVTVSIQTWKETGWGLGIYPNPNSGQFIVQLNAVHKMKMNMFNAQGQLVHSTDLKKGHNYMDMKHFAAGMYLINVYDAKGTFYGSYKVHVM